MRAGARRISKRDMLTTKIRELQAARAKIAALEVEIAASRKSDLAGLPAQYGFADTASFIAAVTAAAGDGKRRGPQPGPKPAVAGKKRRTRAKITDATRAEVKKLVGAGKTGAEIAKGLGISLPSVQNIKKALGLVKKRK